MMKKIGIAIRIIIGLCLGLTQFVLVAVGCHHLAEAFGDVYPAFDLLGHFAPIFSFLMLLWPAYILVGIEKPVGLTANRNLSHGGQNEINTNQTSGDTER